MEHFAAQNSLAAHRPGRTLMIALVGILVGLALLPLFAPPVLQRFAASTTASGLEAEPWPIAPPTYAPPTAAVTNGQRPAPTPLPPPVWRELSYLTSVELTTSTVVAAEHKANFGILGDLVTDRILLKAVGQVLIGVDLAGVANVKIEGRKIQFTAPKPVVISVALNPDESQIFASQQILFLSQYRGLEKEALEYARQQLRAEVTGNESMMKLGQEFARLQLTEFLRKAGFATAEISFQ